MDRGIKHPTAWRELENEILQQIENIPPKRFNKLRKQYAQMGANDEDLMMLDDRYKSVNIVENRNGIAHPMCTCGKLATWWFTLRTRKVFRCEEHRTDIESPVYDQGIIPKKGIQTSDNDFYQRVDDYIREGDEEKPNYSFDELLDETKDCDHCTNLDLISHKYFESNNIEKRTIAEEVNKHIKENHPNLYNAYSTTKNGITHSFILEEPKDFFENFMKLEKKIPIPERFVGEVMTGDVRDGLLLQNAGLAISDTENTKDTITKLVSFLKKKNIQPITVARLLQNLDMIWEIKYTCSARV